MMDLGETGQAKGMGFSFPVSMYRVMASISSLTLVAARRINRPVVGSLKKHSTRFSHKADVDVEWS